METNRVNHWGKTTGKCEYARYFDKGTNRNIGARNWNIRLFSRTESAKAQG